MKVVYINCHNEIGDWLSRTRRLDEDINVGYIIQKSVEEGYINWEITRILKEEEYEKYKILHVEVKQYPYVKTYCKHDFKVLESDSILNSKRQCTKCESLEEFNFGTSKWESPLVHPVMVWG